MRSLKRAAWDQVEVKGWSQSAENPRTAAATGGLQNSNSHIISQPVPLVSVSLGPWGRLGGLWAEEWGSGKWLTHTQASVLLPRISLPSLLRV